jgi:hypothetical protein
VVGAVKLLADGADWWTSYMVAHSGTMLVVYQICMAEHENEFYAGSEKPLPILIKEKEPIWYRAP